MVVGVAPVELQHRELGVVLRGDPLVAEVPVDLEHLLDAADDEPLQIELGRNAHVERHVERVVMRDERARQRAARHRLHHRRLDFEEAARDQKLANRRDDAAAHLEDASRVRVDDQIEIALPIAGLDVLEAVPLLRQRQQALREELQRRRMDAELVGLRPEQVALDADPVAEVEQLEDAEVERGHGILADVDLNARAAVGELQEPAFPNVRIARMRPASPGGDLRRRRAPRWFLRRARRRSWLIGVVRLEALRIRIDAELLQRLEIGPALDDLIGFLCAHSRLSVRRTASSMPLMNRTDSSALKVRASSSASLMMTFAGVSGSCRNS